MCQIIVRMEILAFDNLKKELNYSQIYLKHHFKFTSNIKYHFYRISHHIIISILKRLLLSYSTYNMPHYMISH